MIGNAWLHAPTNEARNADRPPTPPGAPGPPAGKLWPHAWDIQSKSALRKCMFLPVPADWHQHVPAVSPAAMPPVVARQEPVIVPHRRNPNHDVRLLPAVSREDVVRATRPSAPFAPLRDERNDIYAAQKRALYAEAKGKLLAKPRAQAWYEDPVALGTLLIVVPPIGLAALWSSKRYSNDARWALTVMTALTLCLGAAITIAVLALRT